MDQVYEILTSNGCGGECKSLFSTLFPFLEGRLLDLGNGTDICSLHFVFILRIQRLLNRFSQRFNVHSLSTEHNRTPHQLWVSGFLQNFNLVHTGISDFFAQDMPENLAVYGDDPEAPPPDPDNEVEGVQIASVSLNVPQEYLETLQRNFQPLQDDPTME